MAIGTTNPDGTKDGSTTDPKTDPSTPTKGGKDPKTDPKTPPTKGESTDIQSKSAQMSKRVSQANSGSTAKGRTGEINSSRSAKPAKVVYSLPRGMGTGIKFGKK